MKTLVVYDSQYGNTERIAQSIADTMRAFGQAVSTIEITRIAGGKIAEDWGLDDRLGMLQQLGLFPAMR